MELKTMTPTNQWYIWRWKKEIQYSSILFLSMVLELTRHLAFERFV